MHLSERSKSLVSEKNSVLRNSSVANSSSNVLTLLVPAGAKDSEFALGHWEGYDLCVAFV